LVVKVAPSWRVGCRRRPFDCLGFSPDYRSPKPCDLGSFCYGLDPLQSSVSTSRLSDPLGAGTDLPYSFSALQRYPRSSSLSVTSYPNSPRVRSQAFSTSQRFLRRSSSTAFFHAATVPALPPSELSPREDREPLSRPLAPLQLSTVLRNASLAILSLEVSLTPTLLTQLPGSPTSYRLPFRKSEGSLPGYPGSPAAESLLPPASPASKLYSLHESVHTGPSCPELSGRCSPGLLPLSRPNRSDL
jgi:hypothetical protein